MNKYKDWEILEEMPQGWKIDTTAGAPLPKTVFITNGKSVLNGQQRALLKVDAKPKPIESKPAVCQTGAVKAENEDAFVFPAQTVNALARKKFEAQILREIAFDLMVCEIEGWDKLEYIKELKKLINSIDLSRVNKPLTQIFAH